MTMAGKTRRFPIHNEYRDEWMKMTAQACENTDKEIWRGPDEGCGEYYADSLHITKEGSLGINCGGSVYVKPIREWHKLAGGPINKRMTTRHPERVFYWKWPVDGQSWFAWAFQNYGSKWIIWRVGPLNYRVQVAEPGQNGGWIRRVRS